jgi:rhodanese-related sulfurtransferase
MQNLTPQETYQFLIKNRQAAFIDCRTESEYFLVGHALIPAPGQEADANFDLNKAWRPEQLSYSDTSGTEVNPNFLPACEQFIGADKARPVVIICRSGRRSVFAARELEARGYQTVINVLHGFEGELNARDQRGVLNGWRQDSLPWEQL